MRRLALVLLGALLALSSPAVVDATGRTHPRYSVSGGPAAGVRKSGFKPSDISGLVFWLRADASDVTLVAGSKVSTWAERTHVIASADVTQSTDANRLVWIADAGNGKPGVGAAAAVAGQMANAVSIIAAQPNTIVCVYFAPAAYSRGNSLYDGVSARQNTRLTAGTTTTTTINLFAGSSVTASNVAGLLSKADVYTAIWNGASSVSRVNGAQVATGNPGAGTLTNGIRIGGDLGTAQAVEGYLQEIVIYNKALSSTEFGQLEHFYSVTYSAGF